MTTRRRPSFRAILAVALVAGCTDRAPEPQTLAVSAAASLREFLQEVEAEYEKAHPTVDLRINFGASGALRRQIEQGAPADVFVAAAQEPMDGLVASGLMDGRSRRTLAGNELVVIVPAQGGPPIQTLGELARPEVRRVALGAPASVPAGAYAAEALGAAGLTEALRGRTVLGQDVRQVLAYVASGNADAGIVYRTDAGPGRGVRIALAVHPTLHRPIGYPVAVSSRPEAPTAAHEFVAHLLSPEVRGVLRRHGFRVE